MTWILKGQLSNLALWNMPNGSIFAATLWLGSSWWISTKDVKELKFVLVAWTFVKRLSVNNILRWCWMEGDLYESRLFTFWWSLNWVTILMYVWIENRWSTSFRRKGWLIILEDYCFHQLSKLPFPLHSSLRGAANTIYYLLFHIRPAITFF